MSDSESSSSSSYSSDSDDVEQQEEEEFNYDEERAYFEEELNFELKLHGNELHVGTAIAYLNLGEAHFRGEEYGPAFECFDKCLVMYTSLFGEDNDETANIVTFVGTHAYECRRYDDAVGPFDRLFKMRERLYGLQHEETLLALDNLVLVCVAAGEMDKAVAHCEQSLQIKELMYGEDDEITEQAVERLEEVRAKQKVAPKKARASKKMRASLMVKTAVENSETVAPTTSIRPKPRNPIGDLDDANAYLQTAHEAKEGGDFSKAMDNYFLAYDIRCKKLGEQHEETKQVQGFIQEVEAELALRLSHHGSLSDFLDDPPAQKSCCSIS
eukprot:m.83462 g.83462  ORF g.83462 m.83462 type:complete len:327 (+) comp50814_c0_seq1:232-1212(+)